MSSTELFPNSLVLIACNASGRIITCITTRHKLADALKMACSVLKLKAEAARAEIHADEWPASTYLGKPLAAVSIDDLVLALTTGSPGFVSSILPESLLNTNENS